MKNHHHRRAFIAQLSATVAALMLPASLWTGARRAQAAAPTGRRRHLINLIGSGGWDSSWFHATFSEQSLQGLPNAQVSYSKGGFETAAFNRDKFLHTQKCSDASESQLVRHPGDARHVMGPAMGLVFGPADYSKFAICKGLNPAGGHTIGNNLILQGNSSSYAISFSGLVAAGLDLERRRPLHYVMMAERPSSLFTNAAMQSGPSVPICIADVEQFKSMTQFDPKDFSKSELREAVNKVVRDLASSALMGQAKLKDSRAKADSFAASFTGANTIYGSNYSETPEFKYLYKRYLLAMSRAFRAAAADANLSLRSAALPRDGNGGWKERFAALGGIAERLAELPAWDEFVKSPAAHLAKIKDIETADTVTLLGGMTGYNLGYAELASMKAQAHAYAFADYLVRYDHSAVVDIPAWPGLMDAHGDHMAELCSMLRTFSCFRELIESLKDMPADQGGRVFDVTTIILHTEFDRENWHLPRHFSAPNTPANTGTDHGNTASFLIAGQGVRGGQIIGGMHEGPRVHGAYDAMYGGRGYTRPLPMNPATGEISVTQKPITTLSIMPTVMDAFGLTVPSQQVTDAAVLTALLKKS